MSSSSQLPLPKNVAQAIRDFGRRGNWAAWLAYPFVARNQCEFVSRDFALFLRERGIESALIHCVDDEDRIDHVVVRVAGAYVDWTLRQYEPHAEVPTIAGDPADYGWETREIPLLPEGRHERVEYPRDQDPGWTWGAPFDGVVAPYVDGLDQLHWPKPIAAAPVAVPVRRATI